MSSAGVPWSLFADAPNTCLHNIVTARYDVLSSPIPPDLPFDITVIHSWQRCSLAYFRTHTKHHHASPETVISNHFLCFDHMWCLFGMELRRLWINYVTFTARCHAWLINSTKLNGVHSSWTFLDTWRTVCTALSTRIHGTLILGLLKTSLQWVAYRLDDPGLESRLQGPPSLLFNGYRALYPEVKQTGRDVGHTPPSSSEVKNEWSYTSPPPLCLRDVERDKITFY